MKVLRTERMIAMIGAGKFMRLSLLFVRCERGLGLVMDLNAPIGLV